MKKIIVNADDYGLTYSACEGIVKAYNDGIVKSTTFMINLPDADKKFAITKDCTGLDIGVHLNVTYGKPVSDPSEVSSLLDENGSFFRKPSIVAEKAKPEEVEKEWEAQILKAKLLGVKISHIDSHHHTHARPEFLDIYIKLAKKYNLPARSNNPEMAEAFKKEGIKTPDYFIEEFYADRVNPDNFMGIVNNMDSGVTEICAHPGFVDEDLRGISSYTDYRMSELKVYTDPEIINFIKQNNIDVIGFSQL
ncbi:MAG: carbohydrate deacetylase [Armatimonadota bacterium]